MKQKWIVNNPGQQRSEGSKPESRPKAVQPESNKPMTTDAIIKSNNSVGW